MGSKVRRIEVDTRRGKVRIRLFAEGQRRQRYLLKQVAVDSVDLEAVLKSDSFWQDTGVVLKPS